MKRFFWVLPCFVLLFCLTVIPASASEVIIEGSFDSNSNFFDAEPLPNGIYSIEIFFEGNADPVLVVPQFSTYDFVCSSYVASSIVYGDVSISICYEPDSGIIIDLSHETDIDGYYIIRPYIENSEPSLLGAMFDVFTSICSWLILQIGVLSGLFWNTATGTLTVIGVLSLAGAAVGVALLFVFLVVRFLRFK